MKKADVTIIGAGAAVRFQLAEVVVSRDLFAAILERITKLSLSPG